MTTPKVEVAALVGRLGGAALLGAGIDARADQRRATRRPSRAPASSVRSWPYSPKEWRTELAEPGKRADRQKVRRNSPFALSGPTRTIRPRALAVGNVVPAIGGFQRLQFAVCAVGLFTDCPPSRGSEMAAFCVRYSVAI